MQKLCLWHNLAIAPLGNFIITSVGPLDHQLYDVPLMSFSQLNPTIPTSQISLSDFNSNDYGAILTTVIISINFISETKESGYWN